ncbi:MAG: hypothetical protein SPI15_11715 [Candidatus Faecousia sp.]|nr:hypothetical protein [Clostridiales bacterium]MDY6181497.1 hypothetical protein [Candidatus Faecousia sp.]
MYQGKFNSKNKGGSSDIYEIIAQRNSTPAPRPAAERDIIGQRPKTNRQAAPAREPVPAQAPARQQRRAPQPPAAVQEEPRRRGPRLGGVIFYTLYFLFIFVFFVATYMGLNWLRGWLTDYEAAQPTTKCQEVFDTLFRSPDWAALYDAAGIEDTAYEGKEEYVAYMENKAQGREMSYMETSAGLSGNKKYIVKLGDEKVATFTLEGESGAVTDLPNWQLGDIELFFQRQESFRIEKMDGHTAYVNGVALDDSFTIQTATTIAEKYLPMGTTGIRTCVQEITGLMAVPAVTVKDEAGSEMDVSFDEETATFTEQTVANTIGEDEKNVALNAVKTYALFMIEKASSRDVAKYFDSSSSIYNTIVKSEIWWTQKNNGAEFSDEKISGYCRYTDELFSVRVGMNLDVTRTDGTIKQFPVNTTLFFKKQGSSWIAYDMTNEDVTKPVGEVRLTFKNGEEVLTTGFVANDASSLTTPILSAPEGKKFAGWVRESYDEKGVKTLTIMFVPDESGNVTLPAGSTLEPMTLYALFEDI